MFQRSVIVCHPIWVSIDFNAIATSISRQFLQHPTQQHPRTGVGSFEQQGGWINQRSGFPSSTKSYTHATFHPFSIASCVWIISTSAAHLQFPPFPPDVLIQAASFYLCALFLSSIHCSCDPRCAVKFPHDEVLLEMLPQKTAAETGSDNGICWLFIESVDYLLSTNYTVPQLSLTLHTWTEENRRVTVQVIPTSFIPRPHQVIHSH